MNNHLSLLVEANEQQGFFPPCAYKSYIQQIREELKEEVSAKGYHLSGELKGLYEAYMQALEYELNNITRDTRDNVAMAYAAMEEGREAFFRENRENYGDSKPYLKAITTLELMIDHVCRWVALWTV